VAQLPVRKIYRVTAPHRTHLRFRMRVRSGDTRATLGFSCTARTAIFTAQVIGRSHGRTWPQRGSLDKDTRKEIKCGNNTSPKGSKRSRKRARTVGVEKVVFDPGGMYTDRVEALPARPGADGGEILRLCRNTF